MDHFLAVYLASFNHGCYSECDIVYCCYYRCVWKGVWDPYMLNSMQYLCVCVCVCFVLLPHKIIVWFKVEIILIEAC